MADPGLSRPRSRNPETQIPQPNDPRSHARSARQTQITDVQAKLIFYSAFVEGKLEAPKSLLPAIAMNALWNVASRMP